MFLYADGASYLSNDPSACVNCHVMNPQYDAWIRGSHSAVATCNDCHAPHGNILGKLAIKGINGFNHSLAFTTNRFPEPIRSREMNWNVTEAACRSCHELLVHSTPTLASSETSYAMKKDAFDNPGTVDASYVMASAGVDRCGSGIGIRYESLSGSAADGSFVTPLATLHKFNGWADVFLATPTDGLVDIQLSLRHTVGGTSITLIAHDFSAQSGDRHHGREFDAVLGRSLPSGQPAGLKFAHYIADETDTDVTKVWIWTSPAF